MKQDFIDIHLINLIYNVNHIRLHQSNIFLKTFYLHLYDYEMIFITKSNSIVYLLINRPWLLN